MYDFFTFIHDMYVSICISGDSSSVQMPSWLKPVSDSPELSFEERRHSYIFSRRRGKGERRRRRRSLKELQSMSLSERKLEILDSLLSADHIQPIVIKLVNFDRNLIMYMYMYIDLACTSFIIGTIVYTFIEGRCSFEAYENMQRMNDSVQCSLYCIFSEKSSMHARRAWYGWSLWPHQSFWIIPIPILRILVDMHYITCACAGG